MVCLEHEIQEVLKLQVTSKIFSHTVYFIYISTSIFFLVFSTLLFLNVAIQFRHEGWYLSHFCLVRCCKLALQISSEERTDSSQWRQACSSESSSAVGV